MRAISLYQPWSSLLACGAKTIETRPYQTHCRGLLAIHAAQKIVKVNTHDAAVMMRALDPKSRPHLNQDYLDGLPRGVIVAVVEIYDCLPVEELIVKHKDWVNSEKHFGNFDAGRFGWLTKNPIALKEPVPCKGKQGFFFLPEDVQARVESQI